MKDDYGLLRFDAKDPLVVQKGKITQYAVDLDHFVEEFKKDIVQVIPSCKKENVLVTV